MRLINDSINEVVKHTCLKFVSFSLDQIWNQTELQLLSIFKGNSCSFVFGRFPDGNIQQMLLHSDCMYKRAIIQELLYTLGIRKRVLSNSEEVKDDDDYDTSETDGKLNPNEILAVNKLYKCFSHVTRKNVEVPTPQSIAQLGKNIHVTYNYTCFTLILF